MEEKRTVLVVDDNADARAALTALLEDNGYRVVQAADGTEAVRLARAEAPDCIVLDLMMPGMSGFRVCEDLRANPHLERVPIVVLTARKDQRDRSYARTVGADEFLTKPVRPAALLAAVRKHLGGGPRKPAPSLGAQSILAITTDQAFLRSLASALDTHAFVRRGGPRYELAEAQGLDDALAILAKATPAAIVVDARARNEGADRIVRKLKTDPNHKAIPLVVVGHQRADDIKFAWANTRLPGRPDPRAVIRTLVGLIES